MCRHNSTTYCAAWSNLRPLGHCRSSNWSEVDLGDYTIGFERFASGQTDSERPIYLGPLPMGIGKKSHASENIFKRSDFLTPKVRRKVSAQNYFALYSQIFLSACFSFPKDVERKVSAQLSLTSESSKKSERSDFHFFCRTQLLKIILSACFSLSLWPPNNLERSTLFDLRASQEK